MATVRALEDAAIAERIDASGMNADEWWEYVRRFVGTDDEAHPLSAESNRYLTPEAREWMSAELVEVILDGIEARYLRAGSNR